MKTMKLILVFILTAFISGNLSAQVSTKNVKTKTETIKVFGNCSMCKDRIEKAVKSEGTVSGSWDSKTKLLAVTYDPAKTSRPVLEKKVAAAGHDTEKFRSEDKVYDSLPRCCHYDRKKVE